jgi:hypothetical protein
MVALSFSAASLINPLLRCIDDTFGLEHCSLGPALLLVTSELAHNRFQLQSSGTNHNRFQLQTSLKEKGRPVSLSKVKPVTKPDHKTVTGLLCLG